MPTHNYGLSDANIRVRCDDVMLKKPRLTLGNMDQCGTPAEIFVISYQRAC